MQANTMNLFGISFILVSCLASLCVQPALANWPVFFIEKGETAVVPCVPKGDETAYFWNKGEDFATSQSVASRVLGIPRSDSEKYLVNEDGSLVIYNVTLAEGGRYHCRIVSENANCRGAVTIEVTVNDFTFGIEQCEPSESCTLQVEPSKETKLTCTAKGGPSSLSLKWFNGSKEINSVSNEPPLNEESSTISETITVPNEFGLPLTCEAVASEDRRACARFAHVRLDKTDTAKEQTDADKSSARWIIPLVLLIVAIVIIVFLLKYIYDKREKYAQKKKRFNTKTGEQEKELGQKDSLLKKQDGEFADLQEKFQQKDGELADLKEQIEKANGELKTVREDLTAKNETLTLKDEELTTLQGKFKLKEGELTTLQEKFRVSVTKL
ncbi:uncharacterized protein [Apostichopus japonicus]|uniref:uncharacterized protein isoform X2 n=1 Tax=Stichopus japonicus TaxID=307972 RepID=UPI003AB7DDD5